MKEVAELTVTHSTYVIERKFAVSPERVFDAFADPAKKRRWFRGKDAEEFEMDFRPGGRERWMSRFKEGSPFPGATLTNETTYQDIVPNSRIVIAYTMAINDHRMSASLATFEFRPDGAGTELVFTEQAAFFEGSDGPKMRQEGWSKLLDSLAAELAR